MSAYVGHTCPTQKCHSEASDVPCVKNVCVQNLNGVICNPKACEILRSLCSLRMTNERHSEHSAEQND